LSEIVKESNSDKPKSRRQEEKITLKKLSTTRWEARHNAVFALKLRLAEVLKALTKIILISKKSDEVNTAIGLKKKIENFEFIVLLTFWEKVLRPLKLTSKKIQNIQTDASGCYKYWKRSLEELKALQNDGFTKTIEEATELANRCEIEAVFPTKRFRQRKLFFDELSSDRRIDDRNSTELFKEVLFRPVLKKGIQEMNDRFQGLTEINDRFSFLIPNNLISMSDKDITAAAFDFYQTYETDVSGNLPGEILSFRSSSKEDIKDMSTVQDIANYILESDLVDSFRDLYSSCVIFLTIPVTVASAERSFSKLKLIKSSLANSMTQERLTNRSILNIEHQRALEMDIEPLITVFANAKVRIRRRQI
jgi:hypothetical protein